MAHNTDDTPKEIEFPRTIIFRATEAQWEYLRGLAEPAKVSISVVVRDLIQDEIDLYKKEAAKNVRKNK